MLQGVIECRRMSQREKMFYPCGTLQHPATSWNTLEDSVTPYDSIETGLTSERNYCTLIVVSGINLNSQENVIKSRKHGYKSRKNINSNDGYLRAKVINEKNDYLFLDVFVQHLSNGLLPQFFQLSFIKVWLCLFVMISRLQK